MHIRDILARQPSADLGCFRVVWDSAFIRTLMAKDQYFGRCEEEFRGRNGGACVAEAVDDSVNVVKVFPYKSLYTFVVWDCLISPLRGLIT